MNIRDSRVQALLDQAIAGETAVFSQEHGTDAHNRGHLKISPAQASFMAILAGYAILQVQATERIAEVLERAVPAEEPGPDPEDEPIKLEWQQFQHELVWGSVWEYKGTRYVLEKLDHTKHVQYQDAWFPEVSYKLHRSEGNVSNLTFGRSVAEFVNKFKRVR